MDEERREWTKLKRNLILTMMRVKFEDRVYAYLEKGEYSSMEEMDEWVDSLLRQYTEERQMVKDYYASKMYS